MDRRESKFVEGRNSDRRCGVDPPISERRFLEGRVERERRMETRRFKTLAVSRGAAKVLGRVITLTATAKRRYQRWWQGLGKRYNPQPTHPTYGSTLVGTTTSVSGRRALPTRRRRVDVVRPRDRSTRASSWRRGEGREREREVEKPRRKHIHALVELIIPEVLEPGRDL